MWTHRLLSHTGFFSFAYLLSFGCVSEVAADLYRWTDERGVVHIVDESVDIPEIYQDQVTVYRSFSSTAKANVDSIVIAPSRNYSIRSQGAFAQKIAVDFGLIKDGSIDALGPLGGVGIQPASGWKVSHALDLDTIDQLVAASRRAAVARRLTLSADGAEAIIRQAAVDFIPPPPPPPVVEQEPEVIVVEQPPQIVEVIREPYYVETPVVVHSPYAYRPHRRPSRFPRRNRRETYQPPHSIQRRNPTIRPSRPSITRRSPGHSIRRGPFVANSTTQASAPFIQR